MPADRSPTLIVADVRSRYLARPPLVVDCSVLAAVLFDEPNRAEAARALAGKDLCAPDLIADELVSVAVKKSQHGLEDVARQALVDFAELDLTRYWPDVHAQWRLSIEYGLSAYDAAFCGSRLSSGRRSPPSTSVLAARPGDWRTARPTLRPAHAA